VLGILPHATPIFDDLTARDRLHRYVNHVRSSQALAINLFGGLDNVEAMALWNTITLAVTGHDSTDFEYEDPHDALAESQPNRPHRTQVDVVLRGHDADGSPHVALIEVKLTETTFGGCSAFESPHNPRRHLCRTPAAWGGDPAGCFQLTNHDGPHRRRYDQYIDADHLGNNELAHCPFLDTNQVTRNVALAGALIGRGEAATSTVVLCAPTGNRAVWRQWRRCQTLYAQQPNISLVDLPAHVAAAARHAPARDQIEQRYALTEGLA
jgi:hypothetical protein